MIRYYTDKRVVVMNLIDLEHCGFNHEDYEGELFLASIPDTGALWPDALIVNFTGGAVITTDTPEAVLNEMTLAEHRFLKILEQLGLNNG